MPDKKVSVYASIANDIISKIQKGQYRIGSLLPPERELVAMYNVQRTTVRRGLDCLEKAGYIQKVAGLGSVVKSKEQVNDEAKTQQQEAPKKVTAKKCAILLPADSEKKLDKLPTVLHDLIVSMNEKNSFFMTDKTKNIDKGSSIIVAGHEEIPDEKNVCLALTRSDDYRSVVLDSDKAAYVALTYLEEFGHTKIGYIGTDSSYSFENAFYDSFSVVNSYFDEGLVLLSGDDEKAGFDGFSELFKKHKNEFTAVCAVNDEVASGIIKAAKYYKINVPEDLSVISLCSTSKKEKIDGIYFDVQQLCDEVLESSDKCHRVSAILFGGDLKKANTCGTAKETSDKKTSDFLF